MGFYWGQDIIDTREIIERRDELAERDAAAEEDKALFPALPLDDDEERELVVLRTALYDIETLTGEDPDAGIGLIHDNYFETYAEELAHDIGDLPRDAGWPMTFIDWPAAAAALKTDYASIEIDGHTYWAR